MFQTEAQDTEADAIHDPLAREHMRHLEQYKEVIDAIPQDSSTLSLNNLTMMASLGRERSRVMHLDVHHVSEDIVMKMGNTLLCLAAGIQAHHNESCESDVILITHRGTGMVRNVSRDYNEEPTAA